jgi:predicted  nucleic acid-binding Zn-ribbon protein
VNPPRVSEQKTQAMKHMRLTVTLLALAVLAVGCKPAEERSTPRQIEKAANQTEAAAEDMKDYTYAHKSEFVEKMETRLADLNRELDQLSAKVERSSDAIRAEAKPKLQALREQVADLNGRIDEAKGATESTWDSVKDTAQTAFDSSKERFQQARQWVSDKVSP